jgi:hypothetical protein
MTYTMSVCQRRARLRLAHGFDANQPTANTTTIAAAKPSMTQTTSERFTNYLAS